MKSPFVFLCFCALLFGATNGLAEPAAEESERKVEDWVTSMCPVFDEEKQQKYWNEMHARHREARKPICALTQTGKELVFAPFTLGYSLLSTSERWDQCLDDNYDWTLRSSVVGGRLEGYRPGGLDAPSEHSPNAFFVTLHNEGKLAMRQVNLSCDLIGSKLQHISTSKKLKILEPILAGETRTISVELDQHDRWFCYSMCVFTYTTDY